MMTILTELRSLLKWAGVLALFWASIFLVKAVETQLFPVVSTAEVAEVVQVDDETLQVYLRFTKKRNCKYQNLLWYDPEGHVVDVRFNDDRGSRPPSVNEVGPWTVKLSTLEGSTLYVEHRCHPLWTQFTQMYP
jgi:hypothetical protein